ncbi:MAG TPA: Cof-type HAD-IIB family hydrolase [Acidobacteriaceae bacterium]|nr:Cof-type HAD-IIB family hydrolase [Acidobacteriaceae bacterium]
MPAAADNSSIRLIAIDMDGTLLGDDGRVSPRNLAALHAMEARGIQLVIATGRRHSYAMRVLRPLDLRHKSILISSNGTVTRTLGACATSWRHDGGSGEAIPSQLLARNYLPHATALWLCEALRGEGEQDFRNAFVLTFDRTRPDGEDSRGALVAEHLDHLTASISRWMAANEPYLAQVTPIEDALADPDDPPIQAMLCGTLERMARAEARLLKYPGVAVSGHESESAPHQLTLHRTEYPARDLSILDILPAGCSKGAALLTLAHARGIDAAEILAIGDNWNDVSMLQAAGQAVLMDNAPEELKNIARSSGWSIARSNRDDGVADAIESTLHAIVG